MVLSAYIQPEIRVEEPQSGEILNSSSTVSPILMVGWYHELMITRCALLRSRGYRIAESHSTEEALAILRSTDVALVIICQSIPRALRRSLIADMKHSKPSTPVMVFGMGLKGADISLPILAGPEALLSSVAFLLNNPEPENAIPKSSC